MKVVDNGTEASGNLFTAGNPATGTLGTIVDESWLNAVQQELKNIVLDSDSGITVLSQDNATTDQAITAIRAIIDTKIAAIPGGEGGGGDATGTSVKVTEAKLGSDASTTSTSTVSAHSLTYTPIAGANDRYVDFMIDWTAKDTAAGQAESIIELQKYNGSWSTVKTLYNKLQVPQGRMLVNTGKATLGSDSSTSNTSNTTTGLQLDYTASNGANLRKVKVGIDHRCADSNSGGITNDIILQYFNGSWIDLHTFVHQTSTGGGNSASARGWFSAEIDHEVSDASPQYRVVQLVTGTPDSGDSTEVFAGSYIQVDEYEQIKITENRQQAMFVYRDTETNASPQYRIMHKVATGDTSIVRADTTIRVREVN